MSAKKLSYQATVGLVIGEESSVQKALALSPGLTMADICMSIVNKELSGYAVVTETGEICLFLIQKLLLSAGPTAYVSLMFGQQGVYENQQQILTELEQILLNDGFVGIAMQARPALAPLLKSNGYVVEEKVSCWKELK